MISPKCSLWLLFCFLLLAIAVHILTMTSSGILETRRFAARETSFGMFSRIYCCISAVSIKSLHSCSSLHLSLSRLQNSLLLLSSLQTSLYCNSLIYYTLPNTHLHRLLEIQNSLARAAVLSMSLNSLVWLPFLNLPTGLKLTNGLNIRLCHLGPKNFSIPLNHPIYDSIFLQPPLASPQLAPDWKQESLANAKVSAR